MKFVKILICLFLSVFGIFSILAAALGAYSVLSSCEIHLSSEKIFSLKEDGFTPYGFCKVPDGFLVSGNRDGGEAGIYLVREEGEKSYTALLDEYFDPLSSRVGGACFFDDFIYIACGENILVYYYEDFLMGLNEAEYYERVETVGGADWCTVYGGLLYVGSSQAHSEETNSSLITVFDVDENIRYGININPICIISAPEATQGMAVSYDGVILSVGEGFDSRLQFHKFDRYNYDYQTVIKEEEETEYLTFHLDSNSLIREISAPYSTSDILHNDGTLYLLGAKNNLPFLKEVYSERLFSIPLKKEYFEKE